MRRTLQIILIGLSCALIHSCDYEPVRISSPTGFDFKFEDLMGTQVFVSVTPENYNASFLYDVIAISEYEDFLASGKTDRDFAQMVVNKRKDWYDGWLAKIADREEYRATWMDYWLTGPGHCRLFVNLKPLTDYYAYAVCIKPGTFEPLGQTHLCKFTTTEVQALEPHMAFEFMLFDSSDGFSYYVRPTDKGKICTDPYITTIVDDKVLQGPPYEGDINKYRTEWYEKRKDSIGLYIKSDISRIDVDMDMDVDMVEGSSYTILATEFKTGKDIPIFLYQFRYEPGMRTPGYVGRYY